MSEPKRLHPVAMILNILHSFRQWLVSLLPVVILSIGNGRLLFIGIFAVVLAVFYIGYSVVSWYRYTYWIEEDQLRIEHGVVIRKKRSISKHRIQSIDLTQNIIHRIFGLTKVHIETAGTDLGIDAALHAVTMAEGKAIHDRLKYKKEQGSEDVFNDEKMPAEMYSSQKVDMTSLLVAGSTSASFGVILGILGLLVTELDSLIPDHYYSQATNWLFSQAVQTLILLAITALIIMWFFGILTTVIQYWKFTITRYEKELFMTRGLLEKKQSTIPLKKIQAVGIKESLLRQPLGFCTIYVEVASGALGKDGDTATLLFPILRKKHALSFIKELLPEFAFEQMNWGRPPSRALPYYLFRWIIIPLIACIVVAIYSLEWFYLPLAALGLALCIAYSQFKSAGYEIQEKQLLIQSRILNKDMVIMPHKRLQSMSKKQHILHKRHQLANLETAILSTITGRRVALLELEEKDTERIINWYSYRKQHLS
ncbi:PH domain-containing protein [Gracilibacillus sp. YIM 98692]|uniref:PH domain-containing protein n=1 Tax=Gracilibacillus sp. YIM 98692 TaxID=2663532 RepID=UPI0013D7AE87|nr:PH domain-containing protein [Gracilibacillus sp. YIM 98692]